MSYDFDGCADKNPPPYRGVAKPIPHDLETIVNLLLIAALMLPDIFTKEELLEEARKMCGTEFDLEDQDVAIVLPMASFLKKLPNKKYQLR